MQRARLDKLLAAFPRKTILVVGDFFLDEYLIADATLTEKSLETGLDAYQIVATRPQPGAAGTVTANLCALEVKTIALGIAGDDGRGFELLRALARMGADGDAFVRTSSFPTPTYTKPMLRQRTGKSHELNRLDIKPRSPLARELENAIIKRLRALAPRVDGVVVSDYSTKRNVGIVTDRVRGAVEKLARKFPDKIFAVDSRHRIGEFRSVLLKPNVREASEAILGKAREKMTNVQLKRCTDELLARSGCGVFLTLGEGGMLACDKAGVVHVPTLHPDYEIDIVGAGDSAMAGIASALCAGASLEEAAFVGNLCAAVTIRQIGTTGTATRKQVREMASRMI